MTNTDGDPPAPSRSGILSRTAVDWEETPPSVAIVLAMVDVEGSPLGRRTETTLTEYVDPDALDALVTRRSGTRTAVSVEIGRFRVDIDGAELCISERTDASA